VLQPVRGERQASQEVTATTVPVGDRPMDWLDHAACRGSDPELFFPASDMSAGRAQVRAAKRVCHRCLVKGICLSWALDNRPEVGIWGGTTEQERRRLRRRPMPGLSSAIRPGALHIAPGQTRDV
jgi:WhiB family transcriptional regulator, redox-sensing transcriptional regulator